MNIIEQISNDIKEAMRQKDAAKRDALRTISAALKQVAVDQRCELNDELVLAILQKELKKRENAMAIYAQGGREDLAAKEGFEAGLISSYLPKQLSDAELETELKRIAEVLNLKSAKELSKLIAAAKDELGAKAQPKHISEVAKLVLSGF